MSPRWWPHPTEMHAEEYRRAHEEWDREPAGRYAQGGFGYRDGYHGAYAQRPEYWMPRGMLRPPEPEGSAWPYPVYEISSESEARHLRALMDRDLARAVDFELYEVLGPEADRIAVYANDAVITLEGVVSDRRAARAALEATVRLPGVRRVRNRLIVRRR
jgi:hypothetical protein